MKILAYSHAYPGPMKHQAGGETSLHDALRFLARQDNDVAVLVGEPTPTKSYELDGVRVFTVQSDKEAKAAPLNMFPQADVIVTQLKCSYRGTLLAQMFGKPLVHYAHNDHKGTKKGVSSSHLALYNTDWVKQSFEDSGIYTPGLVLHPAVDPANYEVKRTRANKYVTLINLSMGEDGMYDKGHATFFELARRNPGVPFLAVRGAYGTQAYEPLPNVTYMDHQEDIREVYKRTKVLLVPSKYESFGRVAVEAAASGIPSICTPTEGLREAMGDAALYADYGDYDAWNERLKDLIYEGRRHAQSPRGLIPVMHDKAKYRSAFLWEQSQEELEELGFIFQILAARGLGEVYEYLSAR